MTLSEIPINLVDAGLVGEPVDAAIAGLLNCQRGGDSPPVAVLARTKDAALGGETVVALERQGRAVSLCTPPHRRRLLIGGIGQKWAALAVGNPAARYPIVSVHPEVISPRPVIVTADLATNDPLPLDMLLSYVHPRLALSARLTRAKHGAAADVALTFNAVGVLLSFTMHGRPVIAATSDLVAGHLLALAVRILTNPDDGERIGPWEDPVVQRATELGLGIIAPGQLGLHCWPQESETLTAISGHIRLLLGIA